MARRRAVVVLGVMSVSALLSVAPAAADCMIDERPVEQQIADAEIVFVGTVADLQFETTAQFQVEEVWKGTVPADAVVLGGPGEPGVVTSVDRFWTVGQRYLVFPQAEGGQLRDNSCTPTREWTEDLAAARPADVTTPQASAPAETDRTPLIVAAVAVLLVGAVGATVWVTRDRDTAPPTG